ncbi:DUF1853 family protein [Pseudomaricurvus sp.]|uniref:DUF1853 family protein n=1 Tax=Pseudomaricurvus sp. TaxID=2004510 RepID=UPI003F6CD94C
MRNHTPWTALTHPLVRNLAWCVFSPSLVQNPIDPVDGSSNPAVHIHEPVMTDDDWEFLISLDESPTALTQWINSNHTTRLGFQFEYYWQFWWRNRQPDCEHRFNVQLTSQGKTLGELDALCWNPDSQRLSHSEMAVKFYLGIDSSRLPQAKRANTEFSWVGPNVIDRLDLKWQQLNHRQLHHLNNDEIHNTDFLPEHWAYEHLHIQLIMRGRLFLPVTAEPSQGAVLSTRTPYINPHHQHGIWMTHSQFESAVVSQAIGQILSSEKNSHRASNLHWMLLRRNQWFAPVTYCDKKPDNDGELGDNSAILKGLADHFSSYRQPIQIAVLTQVESTWEECKRLFIVPDQWPLTT